MPGSCSACPQPEVPGLNATLEQFSVTGPNGSLWIMTIVPHPLGDIMLMLMLDTDSQSCPLVLSSSPTMGTCLMAHHGLPHFPPPLPVYPGTHLPNQLLSVFLAKDLFLEEPKLTQNSYLSSLIGYQTKLSASIRI